MGFGVSNSNFTFFDSNCGEAGAGKRQEKESTMVLVGYMYTSLSPLRGRSSLPGRRQSESEAWKTMILSVWH